MGIFDRMGKVIQSNLNALLEKAEDDKKLIELNLDEMDGQIKSGQQEVVQAIAAEKQLRKKAQDLKADVERWDRRAELALKSGDEPLAREAIKQKRRVSAELEAADKARGEQRDAALKMKDELERMKQKVGELRMRKGVLLSRAAQAKGGGGAEQLGNKGGSSAFDNFRRMEEKIEGREAEGAAMAEVEDALGRGPKADDIEAKFRELERQVGGGAAGAAGSPEVEDELAALKKRIRV
jgi:phage shock protein A